MPVHLVWTSASGTSSLHRSKKGSTVAVTAKGGQCRAVCGEESQWMPAFRICLGAHLAWTILLFMHMRLMLVLEFVMSW